jgi:hypothetical protein
MAMVSSCGCAGRPAAAILAVSAFYFTVPASKTGYKNILVSPCCRKCIFPALLIGCVKQDSAKMKESLTKSVGGMPV